MTDEFFGWSPVGERPGQSFRTERTRLVPRYEIFAAGAHKMVQRADV